MGAGRDGEVSAAVFQGLYLSLVLSLVVIIAGFSPCRDFRVRLDLTREVHGIAHRDLAASDGIFPFLRTRFCAVFLTRSGLTPLTMAITLASAPVNVLLNYALIFGKGGLPALGGVGAGYASVLLVTGSSLQSASTSPCGTSPSRRDKILHGPYRVHFDTWR